MDSSRADAGGGDLLTLYDAALPQVYGYLLRRCGQADVAEELTSETFLAAVDAVRRVPPTAIDIGWLVAVARHKLADHWRQQARLTRALPVLAASPTSEDPWDETLDALRARMTLADLAPQHRLALTLRYLDDQPVAEVAAELDRTLHATEALLVRARSAFRRCYTATDEPTGEGAEDGDV